MKFVRRSFIPVRRLGARCRQNCLALLALPVLAFAFTPANARAQGTLTNGWTHTGTISPAGTSDSWTFSANAGDSLIVRVGEIATLSGTFSPRIQLNNPLGGQQAVASGTTSAEIAVTATNTGTFTVVVDVASGTATGTYRLTLAKAPGTIFVAPGDEGGSLTNGVDYAGNYLPPGDVDVWTFTANAGDSILLKMGQMSDTNNFDPWIRLYGPDGRLLSSVADLTAVEVALRATNSGTFTAVIANSPYYSDAASGTYRLTLAKTGEPYVVSAGDEGGPMTNGAAHQGSLTVGDVDMWSFSAAAGDSMVLKIGQMSETNAFDPWVRLYGPDGTLLASSTAVTAAEVTFRATNSGTFLVVVENNPYYTDAASGTYLLTLAKTGDPIVVSPGDEGGPMTNGVAHRGSLPVGDLDLWNFSASAGDAIILRIGQLSETNAFDPWVRLYGPDGTLLGSSSDVYAAEVTVRATNSGIFLVVVGNNPYYTDAAAGTYALTLAKTADPIVVLPDDEGGPMTNGVAHHGSLPIGDLDLWNFSASAGDSIVIKMGQITDTNNNFDPWIRLYGPDGQLLDSEQSATAVEATFRATNSGTFLVVVGNNPYYSDGASATYLLTLAKTGDPIVVSTGDEGGALTNGITHQGNLPIGDLDLWNFTANKGEAIVIRMGQLTETNNFDPWLRLYGPDGKLLASDQATYVAEVVFRATNSGTFLVVAANDPYYSDAGSGLYFLTLAKTGGALATSAGDEGGSLTGSGLYNGTISVGDLDAFSFTACAGDFISLHVEETSQTNNFDPWIRLYGPTGLLIGSAFGTTSADVSSVATNTGSYLVLIANNDYNNNAGSGTYAFSVNGLTDGLKLCPPGVTGTNATVSGVGGDAGATYILFTHTNVTDTFSLWTPLQTNQFDVFGIFYYTNFFSRAEARRFFRLIEP